MIGDVIRITFYFVLFTLQCFGGRGLAYSSALLEVKVIVTMGDIFGNEKQQQLANLYRALQFL